MNPEDVAAIVDALGSIYWAILGLIFAVGMTKLGERK
jgi:hypothetical protein